MLTVVWTFGQPPLLLFFVSCVHDARQVDHRPCPPSRTPCSLSANFYDEHIEVLRSVVLEARARKRQAKQRASLLASRVVRCMRSGLWRRPGMQAACWMMDVRDRGKKKRDFDGVWEGWRDRRCFMSMGDTPSLVAITTTSAVPTSACMSKDVPLSGHSTRGRHAATFVSDADVWFVFPFLLGTDRTARNLCCRHDLGDGGAIAQRANKYGHFHRRNHSSDCCWLLRKSGLCPSGPFHEMLVRNGGSGGVGHVLRFYDKVLPLCMKQS